MSAREAILARVRENLQLAQAEVKLRAPEPRAPLATAPGAPPGLESLSARVESFTRWLETVGGRVQRARDEKEAAQALLGILSEREIRTLALSDAPAVERIARALPSSIRVLRSPIERGPLLDADLGFSSAQWGIAETGSLVLLSDRERHRLVSLVPPIHVALLEAQAILPTLGEALGAARAEGSLAGRTITIVTGPSRTADIELTLVVGVHGPRELQVLLLD